MEVNNCLCRILWITDNIASSSETAAATVLNSEIFKYAFEYFGRSQDLDDSVEYDEESKEKTKETDEMQKEIAYLVIDTFL